MKYNTRSRAIASSALAIATAMSTTFFTGCANKTEKTKQADVNTVNKNNYSEILEKQKNSAAKSNFNLFNWAADAVELAKAQAMISVDTGSVLYDRHRIYKNVDGEYFIIDGQEAVKFAKDSGAYKLDKGNGEEYFLRNERGQVVLVFGSEALLTEFANDLKSNFDALAEEQQGMIINGIYWGGALETREVTQFDGTRTYYDFEAVMEACKSAVETSGYYDAIDYEKAEDGKGYVVTRYAYVVDDEGVATRQEVNLSVNLGKEGEVYYHESINTLLGFTFEADGKTWANLNLFQDLLGISIQDATYTVPGTQESYQAFIINTSGNDFANVYVEQPVKEGEGPTGNPTPEEIEDSMNYGNTIPTPTEIYVNPEPSADPSQGTSVFDAQMYEKFGVEVVLPGGNEANAQALYSAFKAKHPTLPWYVKSNSVGLDWAPKTDLINYDLTDEEIDSSLAEWLAGRDYHTLTLEELYEHYHLCWGTTLGTEIGRYTKSIASHSFQSSGMVVGW